MDGTTGWTLIRSARDLLREDAELLPHPQDSSHPHARGEVTEGQGLEATGDCREGERAQHSLGNTSLESDTWGAGRARNCWALTCLSGQWRSCGVGRRCWDAEWLLPAGQIPHSWGSAPKGLGLRCCCLEGTWFLGQHSPPCVPGRALMQGDVSMVQGRALGCDRAWQAVPQGALQGNHCLSITTEHVWVLPRTGHPQPHGGQPPARLTL